MGIETAPAFQVYVKEWRSSRAVQRMSFSERGLYFEMLLEQWENLTLADDPKEVAALLATTAAQESEIETAWLAVRRKFVEVPDEPGRIYNLRLERVRKERRRFVKIAKKGGKARAEQAARTASGTFQPTTSSTPAGEPADTPAGAPADIQPDHQPPSSTTTASSSASASASASPKEREIARAGGGPTKTSTVHCDEALGERARDFVERYPALYAKCRSGALYRVMEARDFPAFIDIVSRESNDRRIDKMFELFLMTNSRDWLNTPGTPRQFLNMMPECDRLLRENRQ